MNPYQERNLVVIVAGVVHVHRRDGDVMLSHLDAVLSFPVLDKQLEVIAQLLDIGHHRECMLSHFGQASAQVRASLACPSAACAID